MERTGCIYKHTNLIHDNYSYIGQTICDVNHRWENGNGYKDCIVFYRAIQKYGWDNFSHEIIEDNIPIEQLDEREAYWIKYYHTYIHDPECCGYNMTAGGSGIRSYQFPDLVKQKLRKSLIRYWNNADFSKKEKQAQRTHELWQNEEYRNNQIQKRKGKKQSSDTLKKRSISSKELWKSDEYRKKVFDGIQKSYTEERRQQISKMFKGTKQTEEHIRKRISKRMQKVKCIETNEIFESIKDAAITLHMNPGTVRYRVNSQNKQQEGYNFIKVN